MRHGISGRKLGRTSSHRKALFANMATSLLKHGQIRTTLPKAKELRRIVDPLISLGKRGDLSARRKAAQTITEPEVVKYLFEEVAPAMKSRQGGYTRVLKAGFRNGDNAEMAIIALSDQPKNSFGGETTESTEESGTKAQGKPKAEKADVKTESKSESKTTAKKAAPKKAEAKEKTPAKKAAKENKDQPAPAPKKADAKAKDTKKKEKPATAQQSQTKSKSSK